MPKLNPSKCKLPNLKIRHFPLLRLSKCLLLASIAAIGVQISPAYSYGDEVHKGIIEKAIELLRKNSSAFDRMSASEIARFQALLEEGAMYADYGSFSNPQRVQLMAFGVLGIIHSWKNQKNNIAIPFIITQKEM
jgi:hypothetical protein